MREKTPDLPLRILKELTSPRSFEWNFRESYSSLARRLGADDETVRVTLKRAIDSGALTGWRLVLNPHIIGYELVGMQLHVEVDPAEKPRVLSQIKLIEGVFFILDFHGMGIRVAMYYDSERSLERKIELIKSICRCQKGEALYWKMEMPKRNLKLREIDWQILKSVRKDPRKDISIISREVGASPRTINRRLKLMIENNVGYLIPVRSTKKSRGVISCFLIFCSEDRKKEIEEKLISQAWRIDFGYTSVKGLFILTLVLDNLGAAEELLEEIRGFQGVLEVRMNIMKEFILVDEWLDDIVERFVGNSRISRRVSS